MKTGDYDDAVRDAIRQELNDWESGKTEAQPTMAAIVRLIDYVQSPGKRPEGIVYPFAGSQREDPIELDTPARYGTDLETGKEKGEQ